MERVAFHSSDDGGKSWSFQAITPRPYSLEVRRGDWAQIEVPGPTTWWVLDRADPPAVSVTVDGGRTWSEHAAPADALDLIARDGRTAFATCTSGLAITTDGGRTWTRR